mgnify:CR=1 FL=1
MPRDARYRLSMGNAFQDRTQAELKRGVLQMAVLALLRDATYGYDLLRVLGDAGLATEEGTLYPVLRRLEQETLLSAEWDTSGSRPRKYYRTTDRGRAVLDALVDDWSRVNDALSAVLGGHANGDAGTEHGPPRPA